ncbi:MAG: ATP-binding protein [Terrimesophilobacter sp.]
MTVTAEHRRAWSLRQRLVLGIVALLALISIVIGVASVLTLRHSLIDRLDAQLAAAMVRSQTFLPQLGIGPSDTPPGIGNGQSAGTLGLIVRNGQILVPQYLDDTGAVRDLTRRQQRLLLGVRGGGPTTAQLGGTLGEYRVVTARTNNGFDLIVGLPMREVNQTTGQLILIILVVSLLGIAVAATVSTFVVRVALRPLSAVVATAGRVAELELDRGEVALAERVPTAGASDASEVSQVGAALNRMLEHVAGALTARQASERKVRQFVADASHELRTPLASIRGYSELTRRSGHTLPADIVKSLSRIESESIRMTTLVEELLLIARLDEGADLSLDEVYLVPLVSDAVDDARASSSDHHWIVLADEPELVVRADSARLLQAIANLLSNARLHTPKGTTVTTSVARVGDQVVVTMSDNGPGIPPELVPNLFERFVRGDSSRSRRAGSTGLGLAITRAIIDGHGGTIAVTSQPGHTSFSITLDAVAPNTAEATESSDTVSNQS